MCSRAIWGIVKLLVVLTPVADQALDHWQAAISFMFTGDAKKPHFYGERSLELFNESSKFHFTNILANLLADLARQAYRSNITCIRQTGFRMGTRAS
jgi:hypothetical protein